jgi:hypothetical protein
MNRGKRPSVELQCSEVRGGVSSQINRIVVHNKLGQLLHDTYVNSSVLQRAQRRKIKGTSEAHAHERGRQTTPQGCRSC